MYRHIDERTLISYSEGQLSAQHAARIYVHLQDCAHCRCRLASHQNLIAELRFALRHAPALAPVAVARLQIKIRAYRSTPATPRNFPALASVMLSLVILFIPVGGALEIRSYSSATPDPAVSEASNGQAVQLAPNNIALTSLPLSQNTFGKAIKTATQPSIIETSPEAAPLAAPLP